MIETEKMEHVGNSKVAHTVKSTTASSVTTVVPLNISVDGKHISLSV